MPKITQFDKNSHYFGMLCSVSSKNLRKLDKCKKTSLADEQYLKIITEEKLERCTCTFMYH